MLICNDLDLPVPHMQRRASLEHTEVAAKPQQWSAGAETDKKSKESRQEVIPASPLQRSSIRDESWAGRGSVTMEGTPFQRFDRWWRSLKAAARY